MDSLSTMLRLLREELEEASWLIQARSRIDLVELCNEEQQLRSRGRICVIYIICIIYNRVDRACVPYGAKGFLRRMVMYLKDYSPYLDSSLFVVNLRRQLELIYQATTLLVIITLLNCSYLYTQPNNRTHRSYCYKVPLYLSSEKIGQTLIKFRSLTLYKLPSLLKILYSPTILQSSLRLGHSIFQFFVITQTLLSIVKLGSCLYLFTYCFINLWAFSRFIQATVQTSSKRLAYCQASL